YLESKGALRLLVIIQQKETVILSELLELDWIGQTALTTTLTNLLEIGLIQERREQPSNKRIFSLTEKGQKVSALIKEITKLLQAGE
ncbi:MAG: hypothetical protein GF308_14695, partial [Candidatus Heimdallarchaeota archaeon]|nr:hypothetical protein [Candidatus Heimdallarchaeota archaeon]